MEILDILRELETLQSDLNEVYSVLTSEVIDLDKEYDREEALTFDNGRNNARIATIQDRRMRLMLLRDRVAKYYENPR